MSSAVRRERGVQGARVTRAGVRPAIALADPAASKGRDTCFPPLARPDARVLILGSLPGQLSLQRQQYYAHPQNAFWRIMERLFGAAPDLPYAERVRCLMRNGIAVWDVCAAAQRPGSLDAAIVPDSVIPNDVGGVLARHSQIALIAFNGGKAADLYRRRVLPGLPTQLRSIRYVTLPSTSPAYAAMRFDDKLARWADALQIGGAGEGSDARAS